MRIYLNPLTSNVASDDQCGKAWKSLATCLAFVLSVAVSNNSLAQTSLFDVAVANASPIDAMPASNGVITLGTENYKVVNAANFTGSAAIGETAPGSIAQVGCQSCQTNTCRGNCRRGNGSAYPLGNLCAPCEPFCYVSFDALVMQRQGGNFTSSPNFLMDDYGFEWIPRLTIGMVPDCVHGCELSFTGVAEWNRSGAASSPTGGIESLLTTVSPFTSTDLTAYTDAIAQSQSLDVQYWSVEANKTLVGYDVAKLLFGARYVDYQEIFTYLSENATPGGVTPTTTGSLRSEVKNRLLGVQCGLDLLYPICRRGYTDFRSRAGVFANFADLDFDFINNIDTAYIVDKNDVNLAGLIEVAGGLRFQVTDCISIRGGGELWWFSGMATATDQFRNQIGGISNVRTKSDFFVAGGTFGVDFRY